MLSEMAPPRAAIRCASHCGTLPPCSGKSALPERFIDALYKATQDRAGSLRWQSNRHMEHRFCTTRRDRDGGPIEPPVPVAVHVYYPSVSKQNGGAVDCASAAANQALPLSSCV